MAPAVERRERSRRSPHGRSDSPVKEQGSSRRERSLDQRRSSPRKRSPIKTSLSHRVRSPAREKMPERARSPKHARSESPPGDELARSLSPRSKRLRPVQAEREAERLGERDHQRNLSREERDTERHREQDHESGRDASRGRRVDLDDGKDALRDRRMGRDDRREALRERRANRDDGRDASRDRRVDHDDRRDASRDRRVDRERNEGSSGRSSRHDRSISPKEHGHKKRHGSHSPARVSRTRPRDEDAESRVAVLSRDGDHDSLAKMNAAAEALDAKDKQKPSFELSGKLAEETNRVKGVTLLHTEPPEARKPDIRWRLYVFKSGEVLNEPLYVHRMSCYLFGRERKVADIPTDHPSCSKQHAVLQYRLVEKEQADGMMSKQVRPYLMDLDSTNGTFINDNRIEPRRYYELFEKDTIRFGNSSREYVLLHENSAS